MIRPRDQNDPWVSLRPWREDDIERVAEIESLCFPDPWARELFQAEFDNQRSRCLVADRRPDGTILGFVLYWMVIDEVHLLILAVDPPHRRQHLATDLVAALERYASAEGAVLIDLEVRPSNRAARALYRELGFAEVGRRPRYYNNDEDAIIMHRSLRADR